MLSAETQRLITELVLKDNLSGGMTKAEAATAGYGKSATAAAAQTSKLDRVSMGASRSMTHFKGKVGDLTKMLGAAGLLGGAAALVVGVQKGVRAAEEWGKATDRVRQLTGASVKESSQFVDAYDKLGLGAEKQVRIIGFLSKTLGNLNTNKKAAQKVEKDYGFEVVGSNGKMKNAMQVIEDFTAYFNNKHIPSYMKASLGAKLFGRGWTDLIPIFEQGTKAMDKAKASAMSLDKNQVKQLHDWRDAQRELNDEVGDLSVQIGLAAIPAFTELARGITRFVSEHQMDIRDLFAKGLKMAKEFAGFIANQVVPPLMDLGKAAVGFWNTLPAPLRDLITTGFVADRTMKFLFGFSPVGLAASLGKDAIGGALSGLFGKMGLTRGSSPANPMYVSGGAMGAGGMAGAGGKIGMLGKVGLAAETAGLVVAVGATIDQFMKDRSAEQAELMEKASSLLNDGIDKNLKDITNMTRLMAEADPAKKAGIQTFASKELQAGLRNVAESIIRHANTQGSKDEGLAKLAAAQEQALAYGWTELAAELGADIERLKAKTPGADEVGKAVADHARSERSEAPKTTRAVKHMTEILKSVNHLQQVDTHRGVRAFVKASEAAARLIRQGTKDGLVTNASKVREAIRVMERTQKRALENGHTKLARNLGRDIDRMKATLGRKQDQGNRKLGTIAAKDTSVKVVTNVTSQIGVRSLESAQSVVTRYGRVVAY